MNRLAHFVLKGFYSLAFVVIVFLFVSAQTVKAQDSFMGYDYVSGTYPLPWTTTQTTFNPGSAREIIYTMSGGALFTATVCGTSNINGYQINATAAFIEMQLTANSSSSTITEIAFTGSTNNNTNPGDAGVVFSDQYPFSETSVIGASAVPFPNATSSWIVLNPTIPAGAKSMRIYRRIYYNALTSTISTSSGTDFVQYGSGTTIRLASLAVTLSVSGTPPTLTTTAVTDITQTTATSGGNVTDQGTAPVTLRGVCWSTVENPTIADSKTEDGSGTGTFVSSITGLASGITYYVRAYATNTFGTSYGNQEMFSTLAGVAGIVLSSDNPAVPPGDITTGSLKIPIYKFNLAVTVAGTQLNQVNFTTQGTYTSADIARLQLWFNTEDNISAATQIGADITAGLGGTSNLSFTSLTQDINANETVYLWITADVLETAAVGNNISVDAIITDDLTFSSGNKSGTAFNGGLQTIIAAGNPDVYFRTKTNGDWNALPTWETSVDSVIWEDAEVTPTLAGKYIHIRPTHTVTVTDTVTVDQVIVDEGATIVVNGSPIVFTIADGPDDIDMLVNGLLKSTGTANASPGPHTVNANGVLQFGSTGVYEHEQNAGAIPISVWGNGSTAKITGSTNTAPANRNQDYFNLIFDTPALTANLNMGFNNNTVSGDITIVNTNTGRWQLCGPSVDSSATLTILGNVNHLSGNFSTQGTGNGNTTIVINHYGNISAVNGNFSIARGSQAGTGTTRWLMHNGNISFSNLTTQNSNATGARFVFTGTTVQQMTLSSVTFGGGGCPVEVDTDATLDVGTSVFAGSGAFTVSANGTLLCGNGGGLDSTLKTTGVVTLSSEANYGFNGAEGQITGIRLPLSVSSLIINNSNGVTLSNATSCSTLNLTDGKLNTSAVNMLTVSGTSTSSISGGSGTAYVNGPLALTLPQSLATGSVYNFPIGKGSYKPLALVDAVTNASGSVVVSSEVSDENAGGTPGTGLTSLNTNRYWSAQILTGLTEFVSTKVRLTEDGLTTTMGIGKSSTLTGAYDLISSAEPTGGTITSDDITGLSYFVIGETGSSSTFQLSVSVMDGWNMVSAPGLHPVDQNVNTWWQFRNPLADVYKWTGSYSSVTTTTPSEGYWMLHSGAVTYNTGEEWPAGGIQLVTHNPIVVNTGWNLIGGYDQSVPVVNLTTTPPGLIVPNTVYGWNGSYSNPANIEPGYAYWVLLNGSGVINIPTALDKPVVSTNQDNKADWGKLIFTDASGKQFTLYVVNSKASTDKVNIDLNHYLLPPPPPAGCFDIRYVSQRLAEDFSIGEQKIDMSGIQYPVTIKLEKADLKIQDETGRLINSVLKADESIVIQNALIGKLIVSAVEVPENYMLDQNYPNPFNPTTTIKFGVPTAGEVVVKIYDILGQEVKLLFAGQVEAGNYSIHWDGVNNFGQQLSSGTYIYQMTAGDFVQTKKMILLK
ncbi:MAG: T9SS type A sorting domain-containing protein [Ignavibacteriales bacterium]|nr:MAG: T9SS type A sorting domain-containing protein [Ignavibacteriales bacterium]